MQNSVLYELQDMWCITHHASNIICRTSRQRLLQMYDRARHVRGPWRFDATWTSIHTLQKEVYLINRILHMIIKLVGAINDLLWGDLIILEFSGEKFSLVFLFWYWSLFQRVYTLHLKLNFFHSACSRKWSGSHWKKTKQKRWKLYIRCSGTDRCYRYPRRYG